MDPAFAVNREDETGPLRFVRRVHAFDPRVENCAYNINYQYPSGGSLPHPHAHVYLDPHPTTLMRLQREAGIAYWTANGRPYWEDLVETEEARGLRFVARVGRTAWITPFAPIGFNEVRAAVSGCETFLDLTEDDVNALSAGIARLLQWYEWTGYNSFNLALYSGAPERLAWLARTSVDDHSHGDAALLPE